MGAHGIPLALTPAEDAALVTIQRAYNDLIRMAQGQ